MATVKTSPIATTGEDFHTTTKVHGQCSERFSRVREAFAQNLDSGADIGASAAIFIEGEPVVDIWGGYFDSTFTRPFEGDSIVQMYSSTKTITALCALILADRGEINLHAPVAKYWPEFAAEGKSEIEVRQLLGHTSGLCGWVEPMTLRDIYDWEKATTLLARQAPMWKPGRVAGYHGFNQGHLVGEVVRRVTGKLLGQFLAEEIAGPLGVGDLYYIGTPAEADPRVSLLIQGRPNDTPNGTFFHDRALYNPHAKPTDTWTVEWRRADLGALNGHGNARGIATLQSVLANGGAHGIRLMSEAGREAVLEQQSDGADLVMGLPCNWGMGYSLDKALFGVPASSRVVWWGGNGGSLSFVDLDARMAIGFAPNRWLGGDLRSLERARNIVRAAYAALAE
jgi:CubicO group peptidase (beta-lactamase class C family)